MGGDTLQNVPNYDEFKPLILLPKPSCDEISVFSFALTESTLKSMKCNLLGRYVEKQMFLERADLRQFEQEKALRDKTRKTLMK